VAVRVDERWSAHSLAKLKIRGRGGGVLGSSFEAAVVGDLLGSARQYRSMLFLLGRHWLLYHGIGSSLQGLGAGRPLHWIGPIGRLTLLLHWNRQWSRVQILAALCSWSRLLTLCFFRVELVLLVVVALAYWISNNEDWLHHGRLLRVHSVWQHPIACANGRANGGCMDLLLLLLLLLVWGSNERGYDGD